MTIHRHSVLSTVALIALATATTPALAKKKATITPYLEVGQIVTADLKGGDTLTYSTVAAGIDAQVSNARSEFQVNYRY